MKYFIIYSQKVVVSAIKEYLSGKGLGLVARKVGCDKECLRNWIMFAGYKIRPYIPPEPRDWKKIRKLVEK